PCKWFWQGPCFRAERPQRGRLREFWQWNCDVLGIPSLTGESGVDQAAADAELLFVCASLLESIGLTPTDARIRVSDRRLLAQLLSASGVNPSFHDKAFAFLDRRAKMAPDKWQTEADAIGLDLTRYDAFSGELRRFFDDEHVLDAGLFGVRSQRTQGIAFDWRPFQQWSKSIRSNGLGDWLTLDLGIVRGLAYYTGMVFEVIVDGERAVAGGGRYDNLIETFGGPPTPAVGFGMGDVVLSLVLQDKGLMPSDRQIAADLGLRPDVFVISNGQPESDDAVGPMLAALRRKGMHARRSYKTTKNIGKLLQDAAACNARFAVIIESPTEVTLKNMDDNTQEKGPADELLKRVTPPAR
ncbi:MAG: ATP phosphoribosyltransferase regulatory subunit, partial [Phycisphaerales bacterium]|nr:ATP phosphoribosyltransferase regulatory subunit [Phycisphaerales bacterium]